MPSVPLFRPSWLYYTMLLTSLLGKQGEQRFQVLKTAYMKTQSSSEAN